MDGVITETERRDDWIQVAAETEPDEDGEAVRFYGHISNGPIEGMVLLDEAMDELADDLVGKPVEHNGFGPADVVRKGGD